MISLYRQSWTCLRGNLWFYLLFAVQLVLRDQLPLSSRAARLFLLLALHSTFVFGLHRHILLGRSVIDGFETRLAGTTRGGVKFFLLLQVFFGLRLAAGVVGYSALGPEQFSRTSFLSLFVPITLLTYGLLLVLFGTAMPAYVAGGRFGIGATFGRIRATALPVLGGLLIGPVLFSIAGIAVGVAVIAGLALLPGADWSSWPLLPVVWLLQGFFSLFGLFSTTLAVVVLCNAYRKTAPDWLLAAARGEWAKSA
ncbi:hypothetical protein [Tabrizicola fusiformis]|uniref:hypothetical protein n=1 Tax=Tabrizicola sp. SY72 TaxID=2741673 RepID=UPI001572D873|nr:hypothetical protein [Tabrizicola sp. SY72]NTT86235.1 hypothetical protein [Tabrizicola sp. SY72]